jgi:hypothetical protein
MCMKCFIILYGAALSLHLQLSPEARDKTELRKEQLVVVKESEVIKKRKEAEMKENRFIVLCSFTKKKLESLDFVKVRWVLFFFRSLLRYSILPCLCLLVSALCSACLCAVVL